MPRSSSSMRRSEKENKVPSSTINLADHEKSSNVGTLVLGCCWFPQVAPAAGGSSCCLKEKTPSLPKRRRSFLRFPLI